MICQKLTKSFGSFSRFLLVIKGSGVGGKKRRACVLLEPIKVISRKPSRQDTMMPPSERGSQGLGVRRASRLGLARETAQLIGKPRDVLVTLTSQASVS